MKEFIVLYLAPTKALEDWAKTDEATRKPAEEKMRSDWNTWMAAHANALEKTAGLGKTKRVTKEGVMDSKNEIMLYSTVKAESLDAAADLFKDHPHFGIPGAWIEVMPANPL